MLSIRNLVPVKIRITCIAASSYRALPLEDDAAHIPVDTVITQTEGTRQFLAAQHFAILRIVALQNIDTVMPVVGFNFFKFESCISVEHRTNHLVENLKEERPDKRDLRSSMQAFPIRLHADPYRFFYQGYSFFL